MKRFSIAVSCVVISITALSYAQNLPERLDFPLGSMTLSAPENAERTPKLSPVTFPHSLHFSYACKDCHHDWDGASPVKGCATAGCHESLWAPEPGTVPLDGRHMKSLAGAYHEVCRSCHRQEIVIQKAAGAGEPVTGPIACDGCHPTPPAEPVTPESSMSVPLGTMTIAAPEGVDAKRGPVNFPHGLHFQFSCQSCHHDWDGESEIVNCMTSGCHDEIQNSGKRDIKDPDNAMYFLAAYHNVCVGCHRDMDKQRQDQINAMPAAKKAAVPAAGPVNCSGCHS